jgi:hypothetical protein
MYLESRFLWRGSQAVFGAAATTAGLPGAVHDLGLDAAEALLKLRRLAPLAPPGRTFRHSSKHRDGEIWGTESREFGNIVMGHGETLPN